MIKKYLSLLLVVIVILSSLAGCSSDLIVDDKDLKISEAEFKYYYYNEWNNIRQTSLEYENAYSSEGGGIGKAVTGFDYKLTPSEQTINKTILKDYGYTEDDFAHFEDPTWADLLSRVALQTAFFNIHIAGLADEKGITCSETSLEKIDEVISKLEAEADFKKISLKKHIENTYGKGVTEKAIRTVLERTAICEQYLADYKSELFNSMTDDELDAAYNKAPKDFGVVDIRVAYIEDEDEANAVIDKVSDEKSYVKLISEYFLKTQDNEKETDYDTATLFENYSFANVAEVSDKLVAWAFDETRKANDKAVIGIDSDNDEKNDVFAVVFLIKPCHKDDTVLANLRYIYTSVSENANENELKLAKKDIEEIHSSYLENPEEDNFAALAELHSEDSFNSKDGGYYSGMVVGGSLSEITDWVFKPERKYGDTEIVFAEEKGYYLLFFCNTDIAWQTTIKNKEYRKEYLKLIESVNEQYTQKIDIRDKRILKSVAEQNETIKATLDFLY